MRIYWTSSCSAGEWLCTETWVWGEGITLNKNLSFAKISASSGTSQTDAVEQNILYFIRPACLGTYCESEWGWWGMRSHTSLLSFPPLFPPHFSITERAGTARHHLKRKSTQFLLVLHHSESHTQSVRSADYLCDKHMPAQWFFCLWVQVFWYSPCSFMQVCMPTHTAALPEGQHSIDVTPDAEGAPSWRETKISACCALPN